MKNKNIQISLRLGALFIAGLLIGVTASAQSAWTNPSATPPSGNADAPLNVGSTAQGKTGALSIGKASPTSGVAMDVVGNVAVNTGGLTVGRSTPSSGIALDINGSSVINTIGVFNLVVATGTPAAGKVLTSVDSAGTAAWQAPAAATIPTPTFFTYYGDMPGWNPTTQTMWINIGNYSYCSVVAVAATNNFVARVRKSATSTMWQVQYAGLAGDGYTVGCF